MQYTEPIEIKIFGNISFVIQCGVISGLGGGSIDSYRRITVTTYFTKITTYVSHIAP